MVFDIRRFLPRDERPQGQWPCAAMAVLLAVAVLLAECAHHPSLLQDDAAVSLTGP
jgi:hypothetical protein